MAQTKRGSLKAVQTNKRKYGRNYYHRIGSLGGKASGKGGFYHMMLNNPEKLKLLSSDGGKVSKRGPELA